MGFSLLSSCCKCQIQMVSSKSEKIRERAQKRIIQQQIRHSVMESRVQLERVNWIRTFNNCVSFNSSMLIFIIFIKWNWHNSKFRKSHIKIQYLTSLEKSKVIAKTRDFVPQCSNWLELSRSHLLRTQPELSCLPQHSPSTLPHLLSFLDECM